MMYFKAILTKSEEVCRLLSDALEIELQTDNELLSEKNDGKNLDINISHGKLFDDASFPKIYHNKGYYYAVICVHGTSKESYRIIIA